MIVNTVEMVDVSTLGVRCVLVATLAVAEARQWGGNERNNVRFCLKVVSHKIGGSHRGEGVTRVPLCAVCGCHHVCHYACVRVCGELGLPGWGGCETVRRPG